jgi:hypothetical protein
LLRSDQDADQEHTVQDFLIDLCFEHFAACHVVGNIVLIALPELETILKELPPSGGSMA